MGEQGLAKQPLRTEWSFLSPEELPKGEFSLDVAIGPLLGSAFTGQQIGESIIAIRSSSLIKKRSEALLGRETVAAGLFSHAHGDEKLIEPLLRFGRVAALPRARVTTKLGPAEVALVEGHAAEGMSGAPVFVTGDEGSWRLLGLHSGHFTNRNPVEATLSEGREAADLLSSQSHAGIAVVTPAWRIWELLGSRILEKRRRSVASEMREFPWRFRDRRHRELRGVVYSEAFYSTMSDHPEAQRGHHEYLIHSPSHDPYFTATEELECHSNGAASLGEIDAVMAAVLNEWPSITWSGAGVGVGPVSGRIQLDGQQGEVTLYADANGHVRAIYLSGFWHDVDWARFRDAQEGLGKSLGQFLWIADVARGDYAAD